MTSSEGVTEPDGGVPTARRQLAGQPQLDSVLPWRGQPSPDPWQRLRQRFAQVETELHGMALADLDSPGESLRPTSSEAAQWLERNQQRVEMAQVTAAARERAEADLDAYRARQDAQRLRDIQLQMEVLRLEVERLSRTAGQVPPAPSQDSDGDQASAAEAQALANPGPADGSANGAEFGGSGGNLAQAEADTRGEGADTDGPVRVAQPHTELAPAEEAALFAEFDRLAALDMLLTGEELGAGDGGVEDGETSVLTLPPSREIDDMAPVTEPVTEPAPEPAPVTEAVAEPAPEPAPVAEPGPEPEPASELTALPEAEVTGEATGEAAVAALPQPAAVDEAQTSEQEPVKRVGIDFSARTREALRSQRLDIGGSHSGTGPRPESAKAGSSLSLGRTVQGTAPGLQPWEDIVGHQPRPRPADPWWRFAIRWGVRLAIIFILAVVIVILLDGPFHLTYSPFTDPAQVGISHAGSANTAGLGLDSVNSSWI